MSITATWIPNNYTILYDANGGVGEMKAELASYGETHRLSKNSFHREGYSFVGWNYNGVLYSDEAEVSTLSIVDGSCVSLVAEWDKTNFTINYHGNGNTNSATMASELATYGELHTLSTNLFTKTEYEFNGWALTTNSESIYNDKAQIGCERAQKS